MEEVMRIDEADHFGFWKDQVQKKPPCFKCGKLGHWRDQCPLNQTQTREVENQTKIVNEVKETEGDLCVGNLIGEVEGLATRISTAAKKGN